MSASVKDYPMSAPSDDAIRKALLVGRHLKILNNGYMRLVAKPID
jgi:hypothetical protein